MVSSTTTLIGEPATALRSVSGEEPAGDGLGLDTVDFERFAVESDNGATEALGSLPLEPSAPSSSSTVVKSVKREAARPEPVTLKLV